MHFLRICCDFFLSHSEMPVVVANVFFLNNCMDVIGRKQLTLVFDIFWPECAERIYEYELSPSKLSHLISALRSCD